MLTFVELCVDLKKGKLAKDGLYQYKNTAQNTNVGTIEVRHIVEKTRVNVILTISIIACPQALHSIG